MQNYKQKRHRLQLDMSVVQILVTLTDGNPAALNILRKVQNSDEVSKFDFLLQCFILDSIGIYGSNITRLYYNYCFGDTNKFCQLIHNLNSTETLLKVCNSLNI